MAKKLRIFISSPSDVADERRRAALVIGRLNREFARFFDLEAILWEREAMRASGHFQDIIVPPSATDITVVILCARLGTPLPERTAVRHYHGLDGRSPVTGTEWEFEDALWANREGGIPELLVYRKPAAAAAVTIQADRLDEAKAQLLALEAFWRRYFIDDRGGFKAAFNAFDTLDGFEKQLEHHLRQLLQARLPRPTAESEPAETEIAWHQGSPFRGLQVFEAAHEKIFFGRARAEQAVIEALVRQASVGTAFVLVLGASGSGKSSLVRAGVVPQLMAPGVVSGIEVWRSCVFQPSEATGDLVAALAQALIGQSTALPELPAAGIDLPDMIAQLRAAAVLPLKLGLRQAALAMPRPAGAPMPEARLVLVIDQLEEVFTLGDITAEQRADFVALLAVLAKSGMVWVLATLRSDLYHRCAELPELVDLAAGEGQYHLTAPRPAELDQMIRLPAAAAGIGFATHPETGIALNAALLEAAAHDPAALPLLEFTLNELYLQDIEARYGQMLTYDSYTALGGLEGAIAAKADAVRRELPPAQAAALPGLLSALVTVGEDSDLATARAVPRADLATMPVRTALLDTLVRERLLVAGGDCMGPVVRLTHEALLSHWPLLRELVKNDREFLRVRSRLQADRARWQVEGHSQDLLLPVGKRLEEAKEVLRARRDEIDAGTASFIERSIERNRQIHQRELRRTRAAVFVMALLAAIAAGFGWVSYDRSIAADRERQLAETSANQARIAQAGAETNFTQAVNAADTLVTEVARRLRPLAGIKGNSADSVREILTKAEDTYRKLKRLNPDSPGLKHKQAVMLMAFADIYADLGDTEEQMKRAHEAHEIMQGLVGQDPGNPDWEGDLAASHCTVGDALKAQNELTNALENYRTGQMLLKSLSMQDPANTNWKRKLMHCYGPMADTLYRRGDLNGSLTIWRAAKSIVDSLSSQELHDMQSQANFRAGVATANFAAETLQWSNRDPARSLSALLAYLEAVEGLLQKDPDNPQRKGELADIYSSIGDYDLSQLDLSEAGKAYDAALAILELLADQDPKNTNWQDGLVRNYSGKGNVLAGQNDLNGALAAYNFARARLENLAAQGPNNSDWQHELAYNQWNVGQARATQGDFNGALAAYRTAQQYLESLLRQHPNNINWQNDLISFQNTIANALTVLNDTQGALTELENNKKILVQLRGQYPDNADVQSQLAENLYHIGIVKNKQGDLAIALESLRGAQAIWERLIAHNESGMDFHYMHLTGNYNAVGDVFFAQGDLDSALSAYRTVQTTIEHLMSEDAHNQIQLSRVNHFLQADLVMSHYGVAKVFQANRNFAGMLEAYRVGQTIAKPLADRGLNNSLWQSLLSIGYNGSGQALFSQGDYVGALTEFRHVKEIDEHMIAEYQNDPRPQLALAFIQQAIGGLLSLQGDQTDAVEAFRQSVALLKQYSGKINNGQSELAKALGRLSWYCLLAGQFAEAKMAAEEAYSLDHQKSWFLINLAHAEMFLGHTDASMKLHMQHLNDVIPENSNKRWREVIADDFAAFKKAGLESSTMRGIEQLLAGVDYQ